MNTGRGDLNLGLLKRYKSWILRIGVLAVTGLTLYISLKGTDLKETGRALKNFMPLYFVLSLFLNILVICAKALRLTVLLRKIDRGIRYKDIVFVLFFSYFYNIIFPMRGGDILGGVLLSRMKNFSKANFFGALVVDKFTDGIVFFLCTFPLIYSVFPSTHIIKSLFIVFLLFILVLSTAIILRNKKEGILKKFGEGMNTIFEKKRALFAVLITILSWLLQISIVYLLVFNLGEIKKWWTGIWFLVAVNLSILAVQTPGNIGTMEAGGTYSLMLMGYSKEIALSFTLVYHIVNILPVIITGGIISLYMGIWRLADKE